MFDLTIRITQRPVDLEHCVEVSRLDTPKPTPDPSQEATDRIHAEPRTILVAATAPADFQALEDFGVHDRATGLMWSRDPLTDSSEAVGFATAERLAKECRLGGFSDWRLPTIRELLSIVDYNRHDPAIDTTFFPACPSAWFWSSSPCAWAPASVVWVVLFGNGGVDYDVRDYYEARVRAVRSVGPAGQ